MEKEKKFFSKNYLFPAIIVLVIIFILYQFTLPQVGQILEIRRELKEERQRLEQLVKKAQELEKLDEVTLKTNFQVSQEALPSEKDVPGLLFTLARLEGEATVSVEKFQLAPGLISTPAATPTQATPSGEKGKAKPEAPKKETKPSLSSLVFDLTLAGEFSAIRSFLDKITEIKPILQIPSLKISQNKGEGLKADFKINFSYQPLPLTLGKIDDPLPILTAKDKEILTEISQLPSYNQVPGVATAAGGKANPFE